MSWFGKVLHTISDTSVALYEATKSEIIEFSNQLQDDTKHLIPTNDTSTTNAHSNNTNGQDETSPDPSSHSSSSHTVHSVSEDRWNNILKLKTTYTQDPQEHTYSGFRSDFSTSSYVNDIQSLLDNHHVKWHYNHLFPHNSTDQHNIQLMPENEIDFFARICFRRSLFDAQEEKRLKLVDKMQRSTETNLSPELHTSDWDELDDVDSPSDGSAVSNHTSAVCDANQPSGADTDGPPQLSSLEPPHLSSMSSGEVIDDDEVKAARQATTNDDWDEWS